MKKVKLWFVRYGVQPLVGTADETYFKGYVELPACYGSLGVCYGLIDDAINERVGSDKVAYLYSVRPLTHERWEAAFKADGSAPEVQGAFELLP